MSESKRFGEAERDNPGPGTYLADACSPSLEYKHDSISKKGYGSLVSKEKRWRRVRPVYTGPGPGDYALRPTLEAERDKDFNRAPATSAFRPPVRAPVCVCGGASRVGAS